MPLPPGLHTMEEMRKFSTDQLYELMVSCQSPGYYQFCVEELQRRFLTEIGVQTQKLGESSARVESLTRDLETTVKGVGIEVQSLTESSRRIERLTKWLIRLTVALLFLTAAQLGILLRDYLLPNQQPAAIQSVTPLPAQRKQ